MKKNRYFENICNSKNHITRVWFWWEIYAEKSHWVRIHRYFSMTLMWRNWTWIWISDIWTSHQVYSEQQRQIHSWSEYFKESINRYWWPHVMYFNFSHSQLNILAFGFSPLMNTPPMLHEHDENINVNKYLSERNRDLWKNYWNLSKLRIDKFLKAWKDYQLGFGQWIIQILWWFLIFF